MPLPRFEWLLVAAISSLLLSQTVYCCYSDTCFLFCLFTTFLDVFFARFSPWLFCCTNQWFAYICACSFSLYLTPLFVFLHSLYLYTFILHRAPLVSLPFLPFDPLWPPRPSLPTDCFFSPWPHSTKSCPTHPCVTFLYCFCFPSCLCMHYHPSEPICTHTHPSLTIFVSSPKTSCPGKFPRP